jgi:hypothetical protein
VEQNKTVREMKRIAQPLVLTIAVLGVAIASAQRVRAQEDPTLDAKRRVFGYLAEGFRAVRRGPDGYYVLMSLAPSGPSRSSKGSTSSKPLSAPAVLVFNTKGEKVRQIPAQPRPGELASPNTLDVDASGRVYIADPGANTVSIYNPDGTLFAHFTIPEPNQIVALPRDQFALCRDDADHLISVYDLKGKLLREFGELADLSDDAELNHRLNAGHLASDKAGNLYFAFRYLPEPTVRKYDATSGLLLDELSLTTLELAPMAQSARQEIARAASGKPVHPHEIISGFGVDPETQELWLALGNLLMHFDNADNKVASNRAYTTYAARMVPNSILVETDRLLLGNDPLGIYEFPRLAGTIRPSE